MKHHTCYLIACVLASYIYIFFPSLSSWNNDHRLKGGDGEEQESATGQKGRLRHEDCRGEKMVCTSFLHQTLLSSRLSYILVERFNVAPSRAAERRKFSQSDFVLHERSTHRTCSTAPSAVEVSTLTDLSGRICTQYCATSLWKTYGA